MKKDEYLSICRMEHSLCEKLVLPEAAEEQTPRLMNTVLMPNECKRILNGSANRGRSGEGCISPCKVLETARGTDGRRDDGLTG